MDNHVLLFLLLPGVEVEILGQEQLVYKVDLDVTEDNTGMDNHVLNLIQVTIIANFVQELNTGMEQNANH
jgi:hypothetical protein